MDYTPLLKTNCMLEIFDACMSLCIGERCDRREGNGQCSDELSTDSFRNDDITQEQTEIPRKSPALAFSCCCVKYWVFVNGRSHRYAAKIDV